MDLAPLDRAGAARAGLGGGEPRQRRDVRVLRRAFAQPLRDRPQIAGPDPGEEDRRLLQEAGLARGSRDVVARLVRRDRLDLPLIPEDVAEGLRRALEVKGRRDDPQWARLDAVEVPRRRQ